MKKIVLIACSSKKTGKKEIVRKFYISPLFKLSLAYAESLKPDYIFILSAKYGLVALNKRLDPYNKTLNKLPAWEVKLWAEKVINKLKVFCDLNNDKIIFLAGQKYRKYIIPEINNYEIPLEGLRIGKQLRLLKERL